MLPYYTRLGPTLTQKLCFKSFLKKFLKFHKCLFSYVSDAALTFIIAPGFDVRHIWPHPTKSASLTCYLPLMTNSMQKMILIDFLHRYWWWKNPAIWLEERYTWLHPTKTNSMQKKNQDIDSFQRWWWINSPGIFKLRAFWATTEEPPFLPVGSTDTNCINVILLRMQNKYNLYIPFHKTDCVK